MKRFSTIALALTVLALPLPAAAACGDGARDSGEGCDDGNTLAGDGCSGACVVETGFMCRDQPHIAVTNGSFETDPFAPGGGWTLAAGTVDWVDGSSPGNCLPAGDGALSIDMNGSSRGQIYQDLPTVPGTRYAITLLGDANCIEVSGDPCSNRCTKRLTISVSDTADATGTAFTTSVVDLNGNPFGVPNPAGVPWQPVRFEFVARTAMTRFTFTGSDPSFAGPMVDRIAVPASICDPDTCGNGALDSGETCDDSNQSSGDGCSAVCLVEPGYTCAIAGAVCTTTCGDGIVAGAERCDDGGTTPGDGCSPTCTVEPGFGCAVDPFTNLSVCTMTCGNGTLEAGEECDDDNAVDQDGCSNTCLRGPGIPCVAAGQCALAQCTVTCTGCYDTAAAGGVDFGCLAPTPACDTSGSFPTCVECLAVADCTSAQSCDDVTHTCVDRPVDAGTDAGSDAGTDGGLDAGMDAGIDAGVDAGRDAGTDAARLPDAGLDATVPDAGSRSGGVAGGACLCAAHARSGGTTWRTVLALVVLSVVLRRRRRGARATDLGRSRDAPLR